MKKMRTKKLLALAAAALCLTPAAVAQTSYSVASSETPLGSLESGTYVIRVLSDKNSKTANNGENNCTDDKGRFVYLSGSQVKADLATNTGNNFEGTILSASDKSAYLWDLTKNSDGTFSIQAHGNTSKKWILGHHSFSIGSSATSQQTTNFTAHAATLTAFSGWSYFTGNTGSTSNEIGHDGYKGGDNQLGGWNYNSDNNAVAHFKFFKASADVANTCMIKYDFYLDGTKQWSYTNENVIIGGEYPDFTSILPDYISSSTVFTDVVTGDETKQVNCTYNGPITPGQPYYINFAFTYAGESGKDSNYGYLYENNGGDMACGTHDKKINNKKGVWIFEGNQFKGWKVKSADNNYYWYATDIDDSGTCRVKTSSYSASNHVEKFVLKAPVKDSGIKTAGGFYLHVKDDTAETPSQWLNSRNGYLSFWVTSDFSGSVDGDHGCGFKVEDALPEVALKSVDNTDYYATYYLPFAANIPSGVEAYGVKRDGDKATLTKYDNVIPANTGVLLKGTAATATFTLAKDAGTPLASGQNELKGVLEDTNKDASSVFVFSKKNEKVGFYHPKEGKLLANKAYWESAQGDYVAEGFAIDFPTTGLDTVTESGTQTDTAPAYDLAGRRVTAPVKGGVYIRAGRKFVVR